MSLAGLNYDLVRFIW